MIWTETADRKYLIIEYEYVSPFIKSLTPTDINILLHAILDLL